MAVKVEAYSVSALKAITYRIGATPTAQLPACAAQLAASIWTCRAILSTPLDDLKHEDGEILVVVNRLRTQLSTLLQDRTVEGRWTAVVLVKAAIEAGGIEVLSKSNAWVKHLLTILRKPASANTRSFAVLALTRIFMLTWDHPNLVREITTPALPGFISACLHNAEHASQREVQNILASFETLVGRHHTIFRTHEPQIRALTLRIISTTASSSSTGIDPANVEHAQSLFVLLSHCAPKQGGAANWTDSFEQVAIAAHRTCDAIFRSVLEDWSSTLPSFQATKMSKQSSGELSSRADELGLSSWQGLYFGSARLTTLLDFLRTFFTTTSPSSVSLPIGIVLDLLARLSSLTVPTSGQPTSWQPNPQISKEERDTMLSLLPSIHASAFRMLRDIIRQLDTALLGTVPSLLEPIAAIFAAEGSETEVRTATYELLAEMLRIIGPSLGPHEVNDLSAIVSMSCLDLSSGASSPAKLDKLNKGVQAQTTVDMAGKTEMSNSAVIPQLEAVARHLLVTFLTKTRSEACSRRLRTQIDRAAVLTRDKDIMLASVMNPPPNPSGQGLQKSLLPILAKLFPEEPEVECLLHPRMPVSTPANSQHERPLSPSTSEQNGDEADGAPDPSYMQSGLADQAHADNVADDHDPASGEAGQVDALLSKRTLDIEDQTKQPDHKKQRRQKLNDATDHDLDDTHDRRDTIDLDEAMEVASEYESHDQIIDHIQQAHTTSTSQQDNAMLTARIASNVDSEDDSDIEIPPLTMDSDTEDDGRD